MKIIVFYKTGGVVDLFIIENYRVRIGIINGDDLVKNYILELIPSIPWANFIKFTFPMQ